MGAGLCGEQNAFTGSWTGRPGQQIDYNAGVETPRRKYLDIMAPKQEIKKEGTMLSIYKDLKEFVREHKGVIFTIVFVALLDKYMFDGALRERLKGIVGGLLGRAEKIANKE